MQLLALAAGMALLGPGAAAADTPDWTTVPDSGNSFGWEVPRPAHKPRPEPALRAPTPALTTPVTTQSRPAPTRKGTQRAHADRRKQPAPPVIHRNVILRSQRTGAVLAAHVSTSPTAAESALLAAALAIAVACFACGATATRHIRWPRGAAFVADQRANITTVGVLCLLAAAIVFALTRN